MDTAQALLAFASAHTGEIALGVSLFLVTLVGSMAVVATILVKMAPDYLLTPEDAPFWPGRPAWVRVLARVGKNLLGVLLVVVGVLLSMPGVPGQGVLTILIGVMLVDIPGKRRLERRLLGHPRVFCSVNRLRARFHQPPILLPHAPHAHAAHHATTHGAP
jgi:hypothetical protein